MNTCSVETCQTPVQNVFADETGGDIIEFGVCNDHKLALDAGEIYSYHPGETRTLQLGDRAMPEVLAYETSWYGGKYPTVTLELGRHGIVSQTVSFQLAPNIAKMLGHFAGSED